MKKIALFSLCVFVCTTASADWQYTHWGETVDAILSENHGLERVNYAGEVGLRGIVDTGHGASSLTLMFVDGKLDTVKLDQKTHAECVAISTSLDEKFGKGKPDGSTIVWRDIPGGNLVKLTNMESLTRPPEGVSCSLFYSALPTSGNGS